MVYSGKVLVVDDDQNVLELIKIYGEREGFNVIGVNDGDLALAAFDRENPDVVILDIMLPGVDGLTLCRNIRSIRMVHIIMLSAKGEEADRVLGLEMGADDYVSKPFSPRELVARIKAALRRSQPVNNSGTSMKLKYPDFEIQSDTRSVIVNDTSIVLTPREFDLLYHLAQNPRRVFTREDLLAAVWGYDFFGDQRTVDVHIRRLREKLQLLSHYLTTVWGVGYQFTPPSKEE